MIGFLRRAVSPAEASPTLTVDDRTLPVILRVSARSQKLSLRFDGLSDSVVVTRPVHSPAGEALSFARSQIPWLRKRLAALPPRVPFALGTTLPILGVDHPVIAATGRQGTRIADGAVHVSGQPDHHARRIRDALIRSARAEITPRADAFAATLDRRIRRITLRDTRGRWGSCAARGDLSFSWRLILAPEPVLTYVVAHEAAHLVELNHSHRFWAVVRDLIGDAREARAWLKANGTALHRYG